MKSNGFVTLQFNSAVCNVYMTWADSGLVNLVAAMLPGLIC